MHLRVRCIDFASFYDFSIESCNYSDSPVSLFSILLSRLITKNICHYAHITYLACYPLANEVVKGYSNATVRPSVTSL
jgi:hypothetical protein